MDKSTATIWRDTFTNWPAHFRRKGVVVPTLGEAIPFAEFLVSDDVVIFERATPDNVGARRVCVPFQNIATLKFTEPLKTEHFMKAGYFPGKNVPTPKPPAKKKVPIAEAKPPAEEVKPPPTKEQLEQERQEQLRIAKKQLEELQLRQQREQAKFAQQKFEQQNVVIATAPGAPPIVPVTPQAPAS